MPPIVLGAAAIATSVAVINPSWEGPATIAATVFTIAALLVRTELQEAVLLLTVVAYIGVGVAVIGFGVAVLRSGYVLAGVALIGVGVATIGFGVAILRNDDALRGVAFIGVGVAAIGFGVAVLRSNQVLAGITVISFGVAVISFEIVVLRRSGILAQVITSLASLTSAPAGEALPSNDPPVSESQDLPTGSPPPPQPRTPTNRSDRY